MATSLTQIMPKVSELYFDEKFLQSFEDHLQWFLNMGHFTVIPVDAVKALQYKGDLAGLLRVANVQEHQIYPSIRLTGFRSSHDYDGTVLALRVVNPDELTKLARTWATQNTSKKN